MVCSTTMFCVHYALSIWILHFHTKPHLLSWQWAHAQDRWLHLHIPSTTIAPCDKPAMGNARVKHSNNWICYNSWKFAYITIAKYYFQKKGIVHYYRSNPVFINYLWPISKYCSIVPTMYSLQYSSLKWCIILSQEIVSVAYKSNYKGMVRITNHSEIMQLVSCYCLHEKHGTVLQKIGQLHTQEVNYKQLQGTSMPNINFIG